MDLDNLKKSWDELLERIEQQFDVDPDIQGILFLIGVQELGQGLKTYSKAEKQDLIHIAMCKLLSQRGYYEFEGLDKDGWPHWNVVKEIPRSSIEKQEELLKELALEYFEQV
ncbi:MAG: hypothetical protein JKX95_04360 [Bacteroidia bacterium]|nr:hypothetical protein [Bacteroidia bacterium]